jgi:hypothetical protein
MSVSRHWKYVCYTDQDLKSNVWEVRKVPVMEVGPTKTARWYKINFDKCTDTEYSLWIDGTFIVNTDLNRWWRRFNPSFTAVQHPFDNCIFVDAEACLSAGKGGSRSLLQRQVAYYKAIGVPRNNGLIASGVLMRQNTGPVRKFCETWWEQVRKWSDRDQIAYGYANHQHPGVVNLTRWDYTKQRDFVHIPHLHKKEQRKKALTYFMNG